MRLIWPGSIGLPDTPPIPGGVCQPMVEVRLNALVVRGCGRKPEGPPPPPPPPPRAHRVPWREQRGCWGLTTSIRGLSSGWTSQAGEPPPVPNPCAGPKRPGEDSGMRQRKIKKRGKLLHVRERSDRTSWGWVREGGSPSRRKFCNFRY